MPLRIFQNRRYKPLYKRFKQLFENVQARQKLFYFKNQKWQALIERLKKRIFYRRKDGILVPRRRTFVNSGNNVVRHVVYRRTPKFKKRYKSLMYGAKKINLCYGGLKKKYMRRITKVIWRQKKIKLNHKKPLASTTFYFLDFMERRLESALYRASFTQSVKNARQLILHGHIFVNKRVVRHGSYILKENDIIEVDPKFHKFVIFNIKNSKCWPAQQNSFLVNYKTLQILYWSRSDQDTFLNLFLFPVSIKNVIKYYRYN